jgi:hypothetical protein
VLNDFENRLEHLLVSLIKMVGKTNKKVDDLNKRVDQLEWCMRNMMREDKKIFTIVKEVPNVERQNTEKQYSITI